MICGRVGDPGSHMDQRADAMTEPENTDGRSPRSWLCRPVWDILLIGLLLTYGALFDHLGLIGFVSGLLSFAPYAFILFMIAGLWLTIPAIVCAVLLALRMLIWWPKYIRPSGRLWKLRALVFGGLLVYFVFPFTPLRPWRHWPFIDGLKIHVQLAVDIPTIQSWLTTLGPDQCAGQEIEMSYDNPHWPEDMNWPQALTSLKRGPHYVGLSMDDARRPMVRVTWGGGLGHWGFAVGHPEMKTPPSDLSEHGEYRVQVRKGAYVWYEL